jgi:HlyD family secretion protein
MVAIGLFTIAAGSGLAYWILRPDATPPQVIYGSGRIEADEVRVGGEVPGRLLEVRTVEGEALAKGDIAARIDSADFELQVERAAAQEAAAVQTVAQIDTQIGLAEHHVETAKADLERYETLEGKGRVSQQQLDLARNAYTAAVEQLSMLRARRAEAEALSLVAAKSLALSRAQVEKTRIYVPLSGVVLERLAEPGEVVAAGQPIAILANLSTVRLKVFVGERDLGKVKLGAAVRIRVDAFPERDFDAAVARVDAQAQFTPRDVHMEDERSRTVYGVTLEAANADGLLKPGMPADAWILWDQKAGWPEQLAVPE